MLISHNDSINNVSLRNKVEELEIQYSVKEKEKENELLKADKRTQTITTIGLLVGLILMFGWGISMYRSSQIRKRYNKELKQKNEELQQLDETKTRFFANISHEYKTPLTLIMNPIRKVLSRNQLDEEDKFLIKSAERSSLQLFDLTKQVLELTKFEVNKDSYNPINFNLSQSLKKLQADFASLAENRQIKFELSYTSDENLVVYWDYFKFSTIIKNLISNALKFTSEQGNISIHTKTVNNSIVIKVKDDGQGIHANDLPLIFNRYYQAKNSSTIQEGGTGIGLAICNEYVKAMNGTIRAESELGKGSTFTVTIPIVQNSEAVTSLFPTPTYETNGNVVTKSRINKTLPNLLLVEDNLDMQSYIRYVLKDNYNVNIVPHGKAALEFLAQNDTIQLIITDLMMPEMNGHELIEKLKSTPKYARIPTIMLTALNDTKDKLKALRVGIDDYLTKPFIDEELIARVDNLLDNYENKTEFVALEKTTKNGTDTPTENITKNQQWLKTLESAVLKNLQNTNYSIDDLAHDMMLSRVQFYRRLKALTGLTPKKYIDEIRFQKSREILESRSLYTIKAVALKVGFKDEKHFSRNFKKRFGKYPSTYLE